MKIFFAVQVALICVTLALCSYAKTQTEGPGISNMTNIEKIHKSDCDNIAAIESVDDVNEMFKQFDNGNTDYGLELFGTAIFVGSPKDSYSFSKGSTFCEIDVDKVVKGSIAEETIDVEIKGGFFYPTQMEFEERVMDAEDMGIEPPTEREFVLDLGGMNFMIPGRKYLIIAQTLDFDGKQLYRINGYQTSWLCVDETKSKPIEDGCVYSDYCENEIFAYEQEVIDAFYRKKEEILRSYSLLL